MKTRLPALRKGLLLALAMQNLGLLLIPSSRGEAQPMYEKYKCSFCYDTKGELAYCCVAEEKGQCANASDCKEGET